MSSQLLEGRILAHARVSGWLDLGLLLLIPDRLTLEFMHIPVNEGEEC